MSGETAAPAQPPARLGPWLLVQLLAGRSVFRVVLYGANLALLPVWGQARFDRYAAATAGLTWIVALTQAGPEKAALKLLPRARRAREALTGALVGGVRLVPVVLGAAAIMALVLDSGSTATLYVAMAAESAAVGCNIAAVGILRALGRPQADPRNFLTLSVGWVAITALAAATSMSPVAYVLTQLVLTVAVTEMTLAGVHAPIRGLRARPRLLRILGGTIALMGVYDLVAYATTSFVFLVLPLTSFAGQSGDLYIAVAGWSLAFSFFTYLLRVFQPLLSLRLAGAVDAAAAARSQARRFGRWALVLNGAWLAVVAVSALTGGFDHMSPGRTTIIVLAALLTAYMPVIVLVGLGLYLLENIDGPSLRLAASAAAAAFVVVVAVALVTVPHFGAVGAIWACAAGELGSATVLIARATSRPTGATSPTGRRPSDIPHAVALNP